MTTHHPLTITHPSDAELRIERRFDAPRQLVWDAHTKAELIRRWMYGYDGWSMPVCTFEARVGGTYRYEWKQDADNDPDDDAPWETMGMGGTILECVPIDRLVTTERFDDAWYPGEVVNTSVFEDTDDGGTLLTVTSRWESAEAMQTALETPMVDGMTTTYDRLEDLLRAL